MPVIPILRRQRQRDHCTCEASLVYAVSSNPSRPRQYNPVSKHRKKKVGLGKERKKGKEHCREA